MQFSKILPAITSIAVAVLPWFGTSAKAQLAVAGTPGDRAVYTLGSGATLATGFGTSVMQNFDTVTVEDTADSFELQVGGAVGLTAGHHIVIYGTRYLNTVAARGGLDNALLLNGDVLPYGASSTYSRDNTNNNHFVRGGAIVEVAQGDLIAIQSQRTDNHSQALTQQDGDLQLVKLDDSLDFLRLGSLFDEPNLMSNSSAGPAPVSYDVQDEIDPSFGHNAGDSQITLNEVGHYLVFANTGVRISGGNRHRQAITQRLTLNGSPVEDSSTVIYLRYSGSTDATGGLMEFGAASLGMIVKTDAPDSVLEVELLRDNDVGSTNTAVALEANRTGITILKLPAYGDYLTLSGSAQNINFDQGNPETALSLMEGLPVSSPSFSYDSAINTTQVTVNQSGDYLFLASHFADDFDAAGNNARTIFRQGFQTTPSGGAAGKISYGNGGAYNRDDIAGGERARDSGDWAGAILPLGAGDLVETTSARFGGNPVTFDANTVGLQALNIGSISTPPLDPQISFSGPLNALVGSTGNVITDETLLLTSDANTGPESLIYTITSVITGGVLNLGGVPLGEGATFTQEDVNNDLLTFDADAAEQTGGFSISVSDGGVSPDTGTFVINLGITTLLADDNGVTDEDTDLFFVEPGASFSLLDNDAGTTLTVISFDATSAQGATVTVAGDGTFSYHPRSAVALQALAVGEEMVDTFTYTVGDFQGNVSVATVSIQVSGVNDDPVVVNESVTSINGSGTTLNLLSNESDVDASDILTVSDFTQQIFGGGGAVTSDTFNFELVPLVFTSQFGATVSVFSDGTLDYDVSTSAVLLSLAPGVPLSETFGYTIFDGTSAVTGLVTIISGGAGLPTNDYVSTDADNAVNIVVLDNDQVRKPGGALGTPTPGFNLEFHADTIGNSSTQWLNTGSATVVSIPSNGVIDATFNPAAVNAPAGIAAAYDFAGVEGIVHLDIEQATYGDIDTIDATLEMVIRPRDHVGNEVLWEVGGLTDGSSFTIVDDKVAWSSLDNGTELVQAVGQLPPEAVAGGDFVHVVAQIDLTNDTASIFINGQLVDTGIALNIDTGAIGNLADWCGTDDGGLGRQQSDVGGADPNLGNFGTLSLGTLTDYDGEISLARTYPFLLTPMEISSNYDSIFGSSIPAVPGDILEVAGTASPGIGNPIVLPSGATVTLQADGSITYDPNNAFDHVGVGLSERDSYTYRLDTDANSTVTVNVDVEGTNPDPQILLVADQIEVDEGGSATFSLSSSAAVSGAVDVNLGFSGLAAAGDDFSTAATVQIPDGGSSAQVTLNAIDDNLYEELENIIVTIESVNGNAVAGVPVVAETLLNDLQSEPVFSVAENQASGLEGSAIGFTVTPDVPSQADRSITVSYSGTAVNGQDFFGEPPFVVPGGDASGALSFIPIDDGVAEGAETITLTLESVDRGSIGGASSASTEITDGVGVLLFLADFENVDPFGDPGTPNGSKVGSDAPFAANLGTAIGSWEDIPVLNVSGKLPGIYLETDDAKGDGIDEALVLDRVVPGSGEIKARLASPADISGSNAAFISMDLGNRRTVSNSEAKSWRIIGLDDAGEKSFELYVSANNTAPNNEQLHHVDSAGELTPLGQAADFDNTSSNEAETKQSQLILSLTSGGFRVAIDRWPMDGVIDSTSGVLSYAGGATQVSSILFSLNASVVDTESSGILIDNLTVGGIAGNAPPTATLAGEALGDGGSTVLPATFIATGTTLDTLQVDDVDAGTGELTATFQSSGAAPLTFSAGGPAVVGGSGTATLTLTGTLDDINASLTAGITSTTDGVTGGDAVISFTVDDGGSTGPGGPKSMTHDLVFYVNEGPTATIDQAAGQDDPAGSSPIEFSIVFSEAVTGFEAGDIDLSASTDTGPLSASVSGSGDTYVVSITGMTSGGLVVISIAKGAANAAVGGAETEDSVSIDDSVLYIPQLSPSATNLVQNIGYEAGPVDLDDIVVTDPNDSVVTTGQGPQYDYPGTHGDSLLLAPDPDTDAGFAFDITFQPSGFDDFGTVRVAEIGGTSNGTGIYLIDGIPYFVSKMNSAPADLPSGLNDTDWTDGNVSVPLADAALPLDSPAQLAVVASLDAITYSVNGLGQATVNLTSRGTRSNWSGDDTIRVGQNEDGARGGLGTDSSGIFDDAGSFPMEGTVSSARLWHAVDASPFSILASSAPEEVTATLSITPGDGGLTEPTGATYDPVTGIWTITGAVRVVNAALAAVQFLPNGTSPVVIDVVVDDGDEDGSGPLTGAITVATLAAGDSDGDGIPDDYELANGLNPNDPADARSDSDNDSVDALSEYLMGTSASDGSDRPVFEVVHVSDTQVEITYGPILAGRTYEVLSSTSGLPEAPAIDSFTAAADGAANTATDTTGGEAREIYRLLVTVPAP